MGLHDSRLAYYIRSTSSTYSNTTSSSTYSNTTIRQKSTHLT